MVTLEDMSMQYIFGTASKSDEDTLYENADIDNLRLCDYLEYCVDFDEHIEYDSLTAYPISVNRGSFLLRHPAKFDIIKSNASLILRASSLSERNWRMVK